VLEFNHVDVPLPQTMKTIDRATLVAGQPITGRVAPQHCLHYLR
jgi:hypothetical protein